MPTQAQTIATVVVFDYETANGVAQVNQTVTCELAGYNTLPTVTSSPTAQVPVNPVKLRTTTDSNGYWQFTVPSNNIITPSGTWYLISTEHRNLRVALPTGTGPFQASTNLAP